MDNDAVNRQRLLPHNESFNVQKIQTSCFQQDWHQHMEYELILFTAGEGYASIGNESSQFKTGDIFFIRRELPHMFKNKEDQSVSALLIQFREDCLGIEFMNIPECVLLKHFLQRVGLSLQLKGSSQRLVQSLMLSLEKATYLNRVILLLQILQNIANRGNYSFIYSRQTKLLNYDNGDNIDKVVQFTKGSFHQPVSLSQVASIACMSIPSFCNNFKHKMQKTYIDFLNEIRINYACLQLRETLKSVTDIGYESGYNTVSHFHRQFLKLKKITPLQYRKTFTLGRSKIALTSSIGS
jgi:AraC-like DNA-binding protein/quercetin dioxygenase-like cupin family protein